MPISKWVGEAETHSHHKPHPWQGAREKHFSFKDTHRLKVKGWEKIFHENGNQKKEGVAILVSYKTGFKPKTVTRDKEGYYIW